MSVEGQKLYPGETATPAQVLALANEYRRAAEALWGTGRAGQPLSRAPYRLIAIHAVELYLNAYLLASGHSTLDVRGMQHDLAMRTQRALDAKLVLQRRTAAHLLALTETREYLLVRYDAAAPCASNPNRVAATLKDVAEKVTAFIDRLSSQ